MVVRLTEPMPREIVVPRGTDITIAIRPERRADECTLSVNRPGHTLEVVGETEDDGWTFSLSSSEVAHLDPAGFGARFLMDVRLFRGTFEDVMSLPTLILEPNLGVS